MRENIRFDVAGTPIFVHWKIVEICLPNIIIIYLALAVRYWAHIDFNQSLVVYSP